MKKSRLPALPAAVEVRLAERCFILIEMTGSESAHDRFIKAVRDGAIPNLIDMQIVAAQLELVLSKKETFARAFNLIAGQGRKFNQSTVRRNQLINAEVDELRNEGFTLDDAATLVAQRYKMAAESVSKLHKAMQKQRRELDARLARDEERGKK